MVENLNWTSEFKQSFKNLKDLYTFLDWPLSAELEKVAAHYPLFIPRALASKIKNSGPDGVLAREFLPHHLEMDEKVNSAGLIDPIGDQAFFRAPQLIHRYSSRALFAPTTVCPVHCRYCFRKNELNTQIELFDQDFIRTLEYLREHKEIKEIIFTGGDPFTLSNEKLEKYLKAFAEITHIKDIRFHSRYPVILPERIDQDLLTLLNWAGSHFRTVSVAIHANHVQEFDQKARNAIRALARGPVQLLSQTVLLKGINDNGPALVELCELFMELKVRPYYLHHPDHVKGAMHFYLPLKEGREIYQQLRNHLPGWALPHYVIDIPGGHGKVSANNPETTTFSGQLLSKDGEIIKVQEPDFFI